MTYFFSFIHTSNAIMLNYSLRGVNFMKSEILKFLEERFKFCYRGLFSKPGFVGLDHDAELLNKTS